MYKKLTETVHIIIASYQSLDLELSHINLALLGAGRGQVAAGEGIYVEANPDFTFYLPRHIGRDG